MRGHKSSKPQKQSKSRKDTAANFDMVRRLALALPGVTDGSSYRTPALHVNGKLLARLHQDGESLVIKVEFAAREVLIGANPETFYITDHYRCWPMMLVRLSKVKRQELSDLLEDAWRRLASKRAVEAYYETKTGRSPIV